LFKDDAKIEKVWKSQHSLKLLVEDKEFKSYEDLKARLDKVLGLSGTPVAKTTVDQIKESPKAVQRKVESVDEEDDDLAYFSKLAEEA